MDGLSFHLIPSFSIDTRTTPFFTLFFSKLSILKHVLISFRYGTPHIWRATFLSASRGLRQSSLRGRIFPATFHNEPDDFKDDVDPNEFSSPGGPLKRARQTRPRTRNSSLSSSDASDISDASNASGRVRGMVDSLEKSSGSAPGSPTKGSRYGLGLDLEEEGTASASASASSEAVGTSMTKHGHEHAAHGRGLPHRGSVNDLFGADAASVQEKEARDGGVLQAGVARRNVNGREPRLLPFPPGMSFLFDYFIYLFNFCISSAPHNLSQHPQGHGLGLLTPVHTGSFIYMLITS